MIVRTIPWPAVLPWSVVLAGGEPAVVLPAQQPGVLTLAHRNGYVRHYPMPPDEPALVIVPDLGDAIRNLLTHFTLTEVPDGSAG